MNALRQFTLRPDPEQPGWQLTDDRTQCVVKRFPSKNLATKRGALESAIGDQGGWVRIQIGNGVVEEARAVPGSANAYRQFEDDVEPHLRTRGGRHFDNHSERALAL